jgi:ribosomal-protein-alanine N-acetyltransferase
MTGARPSAADIVPVVVTDAEPLAAVQAACFDETWSAASVAGLLSGFGTFGFWATIDGAEGRLPVGYVLVRSIGDEAEILSIAVLSGERGHGIAARLLARALDAATQRGARKVFLEVAPDNAAAIALYGRAGFVKVGVRRGYYQAPGGAKDAMVLARESAARPAASKP